MGSELRVYLKLVTRSVTLSLFSRAIELARGISKWRLRKFLVMILISERMTKKKKMNYKIKFN